MRQGQREGNGDPQSEDKKDKYASSYLAMNNASKAVSLFCVSFILHFIILFVLPSFFSIQPVTSFHTWHATTLPQE